MKVLVSTIATVTTCCLLAVPAWADPFTVQSINLLGSGAFTGAAPTVAVWSCLDEPSRSAYVATCNGADSSFAFGYDLHDTHFSQEQAYTQCQTFVNSQDPTKPCP
jgi:hypothetical protein